VTGLFWDVAFHIDHGRDLRNLFTVPHLLILFGLLGLGAAAAVSILLGTPSTLRPRSGPGRCGCPPGAGDAGDGDLRGDRLPLDDLWHRVYGIDVTLWSPTHLLMIGGAVFATLALSLLVAEGQVATGARPPRWQLVALAGSVLIGLSVFGLEFDYGVPQWQTIYQPLLISIAAGIGLTLARAAIGRGGALLATGFYLGLRLLMMLLSGGSATPCRRCRCFSAAPGALRSPSCWSTGARRSKSPYSPDSWSPPLAWRRSGSGTRPSTRSPGHLRSCRTSGCQRWPQWPRPCSGHRSAGS